MSVGTSRRLSKVRAQAEGEVIESRIRVEQDVLEQLGVEDADERGIAQAALGSGSLK